MTGAFKVYFALGVVVSLGLTGSAENDIQDRSKYKYGYVISHKGGSTQAHLESRDGNLALGRYYVNLRNGTGQKVTYFADDLGFHSGVSYSSQDGKGSSKTQITVGQKATAAFGNSETEQPPATVASPTLLFGKKILKAAISAVGPKPTSYPKLNYTPVPGGFYLTRETVDSPDETTKPSYVAGLTSQTFSPVESKHSEVKPTESFYQTSENAKNEINGVQFTTPSIKSYSSVSQQGSIEDETARLPQREQTVKVSTYSTNFNDLSYTNEKSIEKTNFADIDAQIISEVQKHAEQIIMNDIRKSQNLQNDLSKFSTIGYQSTVTMRPIVVTSDGETGLQNIISTTPIPEVSKSSKNLQTINSVKITEKNSDQALEDSGYFRVSLSPSLVSSINVSQTPHQSINVESSDRNSVSNNSALCEFNLCEKDGQEISSIDSSKDSAALTSDISETTGTNKIVENFYPQNKLHDERHYITTIDVQKSISLDVNKNEAGSIQLAQSFPFNKIKPLEQVQGPTVQPLLSNQISVTPGFFSAEPNVNVINPSPKPYILNAVTTAPGLFDVTPNQNLAVLQGLNDVATSQVQYAPVVQERVGTNRLSYENQLVVPPPPVVLTNEAAEEYRRKQEDIQAVEKSIQELRQQILSNIDAQHEEEQRKQNLVDEERKQYIENLKKVEAVKNQNSYNAAVDSHANVIQATASPVSSLENVNNVELVPESQFVQAPQPQYESAPQIQYQPATQIQYQPALQQQQRYEAAPQTQYQSALQQQQQQQYEIPPQTQYQPAQIQQQQQQYEIPPQTQYQPAQIQQQQQQYEVPPQTQYQPPTINQYERTSQQVYVQQPQTYQTEIKDFKHEVAVPQPAVQQIPNLETYQKQLLSYEPDNRQYNLNVFAVDNNIQQSAPAYTTEKIQLNIPQIAFQQRYETPQLDKTKNVQQLTVLNSQLNTVPVTLATDVVPSAKVQVNRGVPFDYGRLLNAKQPVSFIQTYQLPLATENKLTIPEIFPQQVSLPLQFPQAYKLLAFPNNPPPSNKQYHSTLTQNRLRVQPLKPSNPDEDRQRQEVQTQVQNILAQPQFHHTFYYPGLPSNNRLQLRHIRKNQISNSDQVSSQSVIRRGKSLKNLRIEYGFKPPLRPSVEFSEEVKPSIYGPSVKPE